MKKLLLAAVALFAVSFWLPAYQPASRPMPGWECLQVCAEAGAEVLKHPFKSLGQYYYAGFVLSNALFVVIAVWAALRPSRRRLRTSLAAIILLHVVSWWPCGYKEIHYGYFVWLLSFVLLFAVAVVPRSARRA
jgi:hypothetical protein